MSWGEPQQPYGQGDPYGQQPPQPPQPFTPPQPQQPQPSQGWPATQPYDSGSGYAQQPPPGAYPQQGAEQSSQQGYGQFGPQQEYGQFGPQQAYGQQGFAPYPTQPPKKGNGVLIGVVVGAVIVVGGGITAAVALTNKHSPTPVTTTTASVATAAAAGVQLNAPANVQGLTKLTGSVADTAVSRMKSSLSGDSELYPDPVLAAYNDGGGGDVTTILVDQAIDKLSKADQSQLTSVGDASAIVSEIMSGAGVSDAQDETTTAADGALSCGSKDESGTTVTICIWYDVKTFGSLQYVDGTSADDAAPAADAVRAAAEQ